ncbi:Origin of replication complex subunit 6 [Sarracenia purpurea var. burkii]
MFDRHAAVRLSGMSEKAYNRSFNAMQNGADFTRPVFTAVAFYLCAKKHKLKVDKIKLIELCGTSETEFSSVSTSMKDLCHDMFGILKEKKDPRDVKGNRDLLDALPEKRRFEDGGYLSDDGNELSCYKKRKCTEKHAYEEWKSAVLESNNHSKGKVSSKQTKQARLYFPKEVAETQVAEAV